jgi:transposase
MEERKSSRIRRTFTPGFKRDAVRLVVVEQKTATEVARNLGIARSLLQRWVDQLRDAVSVAAPRPRRRSSDAERIRELEKKLRDVTEQRDILKKALAYFADEVK